MDTSISPLLFGLINEVNKSWPEDMRVRTERQEIHFEDSHPLVDELRAAVTNNDFCLPYYAGNDICWFNVAKNVEDMHAAIRKIRSWIIPSYGWEDFRGFIATRDNADTPVASMLAEISPPGYLRWRSEKKYFSEIAKKLKKMRWLEMEKPDLPPSGPPPLLQLRQQFVSALVVGNRDAASEAILQIDRYQLDTADNSLFMKIRMWYRFGEYTEIINQFDTQHLSTLAVPQKLCICILHAFYDVFLSGLDWSNDSEEIVSGYTTHIHERIGGFIRNTTGKFGIQGTRLKVCYAIAEKDSALALELGDSPDAGVLAPQFLEIITKIPPADPEELFFRARVERDWIRLQAIGCEFLRQGNNDHRGILEKSLKFSPNPDLASLLRIENVKEEEISSPSLNNWIDWLSAVEKGLDVDFDSFLKDREEFDWDSFGLREVERLAGVLEEIYTTVDFANQLTLQRRLTGGLPELMQDVVNEESFPRDILSPVYLYLFYIWSDLKCGSAHGPDSQIMLTLADGILRYQSNMEQEIVDRLRKWWNARPAKALLPFLLGAVDLLYDLGANEGCGTFWIDGADYLKRYPSQITMGERALWRSIGRRFFGTGEIDAYIPLPENIAEEDPLKLAKLKKVAIVSLREEQAKKAAEMIKERSGAEVVIVTKKVAGSATSNAATADVVLFVWQAASHAVYRAFDAIDKKSRLAYVQGTGASSIMLALERWVTNLESP